MVDSFEEWCFNVQFLQRVTRTSCAVMCIATKTLENVLKPRGSCYVNKPAMSHMHRDWLLERSMHRVLIQGWNFAVLPCILRTQFGVEIKANSEVNSRPHRSHIVYIGNNPHVIMAFALIFDFYWGLSHVNTMPLTWQNIADWLSDIHGSQVLGRSGMVQMNVGGTPGEQPHPLINTNYGGYGMGAAARQWK